MGCPVLSVQAASSGDAECGQHKSCPCPKPQLKSSNHLRRNYHQMGTIIPPNQVHGWKYTHSHDFILCHIFTSIYTNLTVTLSTVKLVELSLTFPITSGAATVLRAAVNSTADKEASISHNETAMGVQCLCLIRQCTALCADEERDQPCCSYSALTRVGTCKAEA